MAEISTAVKMLLRTGNLQTGKMSGINHMRIFIYLNFEPLTNPELFFFSEKVIKKGAEGVSKFCLLFKVGLLEPARPAICVRHLPPLPPHA